MQTIFRKMGNSVGVIFPKAALRQMGAEAGTPIDLSIDGKVATLKLVANPREGWEEAAKAIAAAEEDPDEAAWCAFGNDGDKNLTW